MSDKEEIVETIIRVVERTKTWRSTLATNHRSNRRTVSGSITAYIVQADGPKTDGSNLKGNAAKAFDSLRAVIEEDGQSPPAGSPGFPDGIVVASRDAWRNRFYQDAWAKEPKAEEVTLRQRFSRAAKELTEQEQIATIGEWFWVL